MAQPTIRKRLGQRCTGPDCKGHGCHSWGFVLDLGTDAEGKRQQLRKGGYTTKTEAGIALDEQKSRLRTGEAVKASKITLSEYLTGGTDGGWHGRQRSQLRASTHYSYGSVIRSRITPYLGQTPLGKLSSLHIEQWCDKLHGQGLSRRSVQYAFTVLSHALKDARRHRLIGTNPCADWHPPAPQPADSTWWTAEQVRAFIAAATSDELYGAALITLAGTGLRRGEALGLRWGAVDLDNATAAIRETLLILGSTPITSQPKTRHGVRTIPLPAPVVDALRGQRRQQAQHRLAAGMGAADADTYVFTNAYGEPLNPNTVSAAFKRIAKQAGLPAARLHDLRHGFVSAAVEAGVSLAVVSQIAGHHSPAFTAARYTHARGEQAAAAARIGSAIFGA